MPSWEPLAGRSGRTGAVEVEGKSRKDMNELLKINYETEQIYTQVWKLKVNMLIGLKICQHMVLLKMRTT